MTNRITDYKKMLNKIKKVTAGLNEEDILEEAGFFLNEDPTAKRIFFYYDSDGSEQLHTDYGIFHYPAPEDGDTAVKRVLRDAGLIKDDRN